MNGYVNLLPWEFRRRNIARRVLIRWAIIALLLTLGAGAFAWNGQYALRTSEAALRQLAAQAAPLREVEAESHQLAESLERTHQRRELLDHLHATGRPLQLIGVVSRSAAAASGNILVQRLEITETESTVPNSSAANSDSQTERVSVTSRRLGLSGMATDDLALSRFISKLREVGVFDTVELRTSNDIDLAAGSARKYVMECSF